VRRHRRNPLRTTTRLVAGALLIIALAIRVGYVEATHYKAINDAGTYNHLASTIARFGDYRTGTGPGSGAGGSRGPTAYFPPAFPYALAVADLIDGHQAGGRTAVPGERIEMAILGTIAVGLIGLVALEAFGIGPALAAMAIATVYPVMVELSGVLVAENLLVVLELAAVWTALRARRATGGRVWIWAAATGVLAGLGTLAHENAFLYALPLAVALWPSARPRATRIAARVRTLAAPTVFLIMMAATIAPWTIRNAIELHHFIPVSDETGITLVGTYNGASAHNPRLPYKWELFLKAPAERPVARAAHRQTEPELNATLESQGLDYIRAHPGSVLTVAFSNLRRMFEVRSIYAWHASALAIGLSPSTAEVGIMAFWVLCVLAILGARTAAVRAGPKWLWWVPVLYALSVVFINVETPRFRDPIDPFLVLLAGCALSAAAQRLGLGGAPIRRRRRAPELTRDAELVQMVQRLA
jgi:4-amino-4-deoxy-L-arabinose transferase-like glycosyltransferase